MKPHCDIETGEIYGCENDSFQWWHEKGHIVFNSNPETSWMLMLKSYCFDIWMFSIMVSIIWKVAFYSSVIFWGTYTYLTIYEEYWCNNYAKLNYKENKNGMDKESI